MTSQLRELVLAYFKGQDQAEVAIQLEPAYSALRVVLSGEVAARFRSIATIISEQPLQCELRLLFDRSAVAAAPEYEFVAQGSRLLSLMRNDLERQSVYTRSGAILNFDGDFGDLESLGIAVSNCHPSASSRFVARRFYLLRYLVRQTTDHETVEDIVPLVVDPDKWEVLAPERAGCFSSLVLTDLDKVWKAEDFKKPQPEPLQIEKAIGLGDKELPKRVQDQIDGRAAEAERQRDVEDERNRQYYEKTIAATTRVAERRRLEDEEVREKEKIKQQYDNSVETALLSVEEIVVPQIDYELTVELDGKTYPVAATFRLDPVEQAGEQLFTESCSRCEQHLKWSFCLAGSHLHCDGPQCRSAKMCWEDPCPASSCAEHALDCDECNRTVCPSHDHRCLFCSDGHHCSEHIQETTDGSEICQQCASPCEQCNSIFAPEQVKKCNSCGMDFCVEHRSACPACSEPFCEPHGTNVVDHAYRYCLNCVDQCVDCTPDVSHAREDLSHCSACSETLCKRHRSYCNACGKAICARHALDTPTGPGCPGCFAACQTCDTIDERHLLLACVECGDSDESLYCANHATTCCSCGHPTCQGHQVNLADEQVACGGCSSGCGECHKHFLTSDLVNCVQCEKQVCGKHAHTSEFVNDEIYCSSHAKAFCSCPGCERRGPRRQLTKKCELCLITYCPQCSYQGDEDTICDFCNSLETVGYDAEQYPQICDLLRASSLMPDDFREGVIAAFVEYSDFKIQRAITAKHEIYHAEWRGWFGFFRKRFIKVTSFVFTLDRETGELVVGRVNHL